jgi:cytochrome b561
VSAVRNTSEGYGLVTKFLHWLMLAALAVQFAIGYSLQRTDLLEGVVDRWFDGEEERLLPVHAALGVGILLLAVLRVLWRTSGPLPRWAEGLSPAERRLTTWVERLLYLLMFLIPLTGLGLLLGSGEDWDIGADGEWQAPFEIADDGLLLTAHIATHLTFFAAFVVHVGIVLKHQLVDRDRLLNRML